MFVSSVLAIVVPYNKSGDLPGTIWAPKAHSNGHSEANLRGPVMVKGLPGSLNGPIRYSFWIVSCII